MTTTKPSIHTITFTTALACAAETVRAVDVTMITTPPGAVLLCGDRAAFELAVLEGLERNATRDEIASFDRCMRTALEALVETWKCAHTMGVRDGLAWDLDGFDSLHRVRVCTGWDEATIAAMGPEAFGALCGLNAEETAGRGTRWEVACDGYNVGAREGALSPQEERTGNEAVHRA